MTAAAEPAGKRTNEQINEYGHAIQVVALAFLLEIALGPCVALPQTHTLKGEVTGDDNAPIAGASCTLIGPGLPPGGRPRTTGDRGGFEFTGLTPGSYDLTCAALGYEPIVRKDIEVTEGESPILQFVLPREEILRQSVEVKEKAPAVALEHHRATRHDQLRRDPGVAAGGAEIPGGFAACARRDSDARTEE